MPQKIETFTLNAEIKKFSNQQLVGGFFHAGRNYQWWSQTLLLANGNVIENCYNVQTNIGLDWPETWYKDFSRTLDYYSPHFQAIIDREQADAKT